LRAAAALVLIWFNGGCTNDCSDRVVDVAQAIPAVRTIAVEGTNGEILWKLNCSALTLSRVVYGVLPPGAEQTVPARGVHPRLFRENEKIVVRIYSDTSLYVIHAVTAGPRQFCGGWYEAGRSARRRSAGVAPAIDLAYGRSVLTPDAPAAR
jgi:hypothetical protein